MAEKTAGLSCETLGCDAPYPIEAGRYGERWLCPTCRKKESPSDQIPLAEQTAIASDCIRECTAYLKQLQEFYDKAVECQFKMLPQVHEYAAEWSYDDCEILLEAAKILTESVAKIIDRLPVGVK